MKKFIIIGGCPATGKKTIGLNLSMVTGMPFLEYSTYLLDTGAAMVIKGEVIIDESKAEDVFDGLTGKYIISGTYALRLVNPDEVSRVIIIRCNPFVLFYRYLIRNYELVKIRENLTAEFIDKCLSETLEIVGEKRVMQIDSTYETPYTIAIRIVRALKSNYLIYDKVDWLSYIGDQNKLKMLMI
ncbi:MAG: AAA family ATPase [Nitrososphaeria archaeon]